MLLQQVTLRNYGQFEHLELTLPAERHPAFGRLRLTLIVGQNGTGKTTLFRFLTDLFSAVPNAQLEGCSATYRMSHSRTFSGALPKPPVEVPQGIIISTYSPADGFSRVTARRDRVVPMMYLGLDVERMQRKMLNPSRLFLTDVVTTMLGESEARRNQVALLLDRIGFSSQFGLEIDPNLQRLRTRMSDYPDQPHTPPYLVPATRWIKFVKGLSHKGLVQERRRRFIKVETPDLDNYPTGVAGFVSDLTTLSRAPRPFTYNPITGLVFQREGKWIPLEGFSSGERALFFRFLGLIREVTDNSLVLIDEPEIHLHPHWVQRFVGLLTTLFRDVNAHVLIASHSPLIASDVPADCILGLKRVAGKIEPYTIKDRSLGTSPSVILRAVFGLTDEMGDFTRQVITHIRECIANRKYEQALALYDLLGDSDEKYELFKELRPLMGRG